MINKVASSVAKPFLSRLHKRQEDILQHLLDLDAEFNRRTKLWDQVQETVGASARRTSKVWTGSRSSRS